MKKLNQQIFIGERAAFQLQDTEITHSIFENGESPLKESTDIEVQQSIFRWKYPFWYSHNGKIANSILENDARAGIWYTDNIRIDHTVIDAPKIFRRSSHIMLNHVDLTNAQETLWMCDHIQLNEVSAKGDYFAMNSQNIDADHFCLVGNYSFDGGKNIHIQNAKILSKDAFWNCENVTVKNSFIAGEYIGWNSRHLTFENCTIESLQGFCYIEGLTLINCRLLETSLAFEYCRNIDIDVTTRISSIKNPYNGIIRAAGIDEIIFDDPKIDRNLTEIIIKDSDNV